MNGLLLSDDMTVHPILKGQQVLVSPEQDLFGRNPGPGGDHLGHIRIPDNGSALFLGTLADEFVAQFLISLLNGCQQFGRIFDAFPNLSDAQFAPAGRFIQEVNGLIREFPVRDIADRVVNRCGQGLIGNGHMVELFVPVPDSLKDSQCLCPGGFIDVNPLKPSGQCHVFFKILAVLRPCRRSDDPHVSPGQRRLQHVSGIHGTICPAAAHHHVNLINEQDGIGIFLQGIHQARHAVLKIPPEFGSGHQPGHIQCIDFQIFHGRRNLVHDDLLCQSFHHRRFPDAGFTDEERIVLGLLSQHLNNGIDFLFAADHGFKAHFSGFLCQIARVLAEGVGGR